MACEPSKPTTSPEPAPTEPVAAQPEPEPEPEPEAEPEPAPEPEQPAEISEIAEPVFEQEGFEARDLHCSLPEPTRNADKYIHAGLADQDAALDACAPKGAAIEVQWEYVSSQAQNVSVVASDSKMANCIAKAMQGVRAGVSAKCSAVLLVGDPTGAAAAYDAR